jgi:Flp pilus assembly protein TadB
MLTKDQAEVISNDLLSQKHARQSEVKNARAARVPWFYRSASLLELEPWQQADLVSEATKLVGRHWAATATSLAWFCLVALAWWAFGAVAAGWAFAVLILALVVPITSIRTWFVRRELASLLQRRKQG